jgi:hypothetical protein
MRKSKAEPHLVSLANFLEGLLSTRLLVNILSEKRI